MKTWNLTLEGALAVTAKVAADLRARAEDCVARGQPHAAESLDEEARAVELVLSVARRTHKTK